MKSNACYAFFAAALTCTAVTPAVARTYFDVDSAGSLASGLPVFTGHRGWKDMVFCALGDYALTGDLTHGLGLFAIVA